MVSKNQNEIKYITVAELIKLHEKILDETGGEYGVLNYGNLEFIVDFIKSQIFSIKITDIFYLASLIARGIISGHPFVDGNKRAGIEACDLFLRKNGYFLEMKPEEGVEFTLSVAKSDIDLNDICRWLKQHSRKI
jgi:death-on-curing protein